MKHLIFSLSVGILLVFTFGAAFGPASVFAQDTDASQGEITRLQAILIQLLDLVTQLQKQLLVGLQAQTASSIGCGQAEIVWEKVSGAQEYVLYRDGVQVYSGKDVKFTDTGLMRSTQYAYTVRARNAGGLSSASPAQTTTLSSQCPPPVPFVWAQAGVCGGNVQISWSKTQGASYYEVFRGKTRISGRNFFSFVDRGLRAEKEYIYKVRAGNSGGLGVFSQEVKIKSSAICPPLAPETPEVGSPFLDESVAQEGILIFAIKGSPSGAKIRPERSGNVLNFKARAELSSIVIERVDVDFSDRVWLFLSDIVIRDGSRDVATVKAEEAIFTLIGDNRWRVRLSGFAIEVKKGKSKTISVRVTAKDNTNLRDSREIDVSIPAGSVRGRDEIGIMHFGPSVQDAGTFVQTFFVEKD